MVRSSFRRRADGREPFFPSLLLSMFVLGASCGVAVAGQGDCGQPVSTGDAATAADALRVLRVAVSLDTCEPCVCDANGDGSVKAADALMILRRAVGQQVVLTCGACGPSACEALVWHATSGEPFDTLRVDGVPSDWADVYGRIGSDDDTLTGVLRNDDGSVDVIVPLHPSGDVDGGQAGITLTDGTIKCPAEAITIESLPDGVDGTTMQVRQLLEQMAALFAGLSGTTPEALGAASLDEIAPELVAAALAQKALDSPDSPNSLAAMLAGTAPDVGAVDVDLLDRMLTKIGLVDHLQDTLDEWSAIEELTKPLAPAARAASVPAAAETSCSPIGQVTFGIASAAELSDLMQDNAAGDDALSGIDAEFNAMLAQIGAMAGIVAPPIGQVCGAMFFIKSSYDQIRVNLYPSRITRLEVDIDHDGRVPEDRMHDGPPYPEWSNPRIWAANKGWNLTRVTVEAMLQVAQLSGKLTSNSNVADYAWGDTVNKSLGDLPQAECWRIDPTEWGPIGGGRDPKYLTPVWFGTSIDQVLYEFFVPVHIGDSIFRLKTNSASFTGPVIEIESTVSVVRKKPLADSPRQTVEPGETVVVDVSVIDSWKPDLVEWQVPGFIADAVEENPAEGQHRLTFTAPMDRDLYPFDVRLASTSLELDPADPPREAVTEIDVGLSLEISPEPPCLSSGEAILLTTAITGLADGEDDTVSWTRSGAGTLTDHGDGTATYTAPASGEGVATIRAELALDSDVFDEVTATFGLCDINLDVGGIVSLSTSAPSPNDVATEKFDPETVQQPPVVIPTSWWRGRSEFLSASLFGSYESTVSDNMGMSHDIGHVVGAGGSASFTSTSAGAAGFAASWNVQADCQTIPNSDGTIHCGDGASTIVWNPVYWIFVEEAGTYRVQFELECSGSDGSDGNYAAGAGFAMWRFAGKGGPALPPNGFDFLNFIDPLNPFGGPPADPMGLGLTFPCDASSPVMIDQTFDLVAPEQPGTVDAVMIYGTIGSAASVPPVDPLNPEPPPAGSYLLEGTLSGSYSVTRVGD